MSAEGPDPTESWVSAACTLPAEERPLRVAEFDELLSSAVRDLGRPEPGRLTLELEPTAEVAASTAGLVMRETDCCSLFTFTLTATGGQLLLEVVVPAAHIVVLDALAARATTAMGRGDRRRS